MKKSISILAIILILSNLIAICLTGNAYATEKTDKSTLQLEIINNDKNEEIQIYVLLSKEYIEKAIINDGIEYNGVNTLKENKVSNIDIEEQYVQDQVYIENDIEYVQILLQPNSKGIYQFEALNYFLTSSSRIDNILFRIKDGNNDFIAHLTDKFKSNKNNIYEIQYDHGNQTLKQPDKTVFSFATVFLIILLIIIVIIGLISYKKQRSK